MMYTYFKHVKHRSYSVQNKNLNIYSLCKNELKEWERILSYQLYWQMYFDLNEFIQTIFFGQLMTANWNSYMIVTKIMKIEFIVNILKVIEQKK